MVRPRVLLLAPEKHTGRPQPPSVLICCDCCSLIIENNKAKSFLSCLVCCLSLWPRLSDAAVCLVPLDQNGSSVISGAGTAGGVSIRLLQRVRGIVSCNNSELVFTPRSLIYLLHKCISVGSWSTCGILSQVPSSNRRHGISICHMRGHTLTHDSPQKQAPGSAWRNLWSILHLSHDVNSL